MSATEDMRFVFQVQSQGEAFLVMAKDYSTALKRAVGYIYTTTATEYQMATDCVESITLIGEIVNQDIS